MPLRREESSAGRNEKPFPAARVIFVIQLMERKRPCPKPSTPTTNGSAFPPRISRRITIACLGLTYFEDNPDVIASAADKQMAHIRSFQTGQHSALSQKILNEIAAARICLLNAAKKAQYDEKLRGQLAALESQSQQAEPFDPSKIGLDFSATKSASVAKRPRKSHRNEVALATARSHWSRIIGICRHYRVLTVQSPRRRKACDAGQSRRAVKDKMTQARSQSQERKSRQNLNQDPRPSLKSNPNQNLIPEHLNPNPNPDPSRSLNQNLNLLPNLPKRLRIVSKTPSPRPRPPPISGLSQSMP